MIRTQIKRFFIRLIPRHASVANNPLFKIAINNGLFATLAWRGIKRIWYPEILNRYLNPIRFT